MATKADEHASTTSGAASQPKAQPGRRRRHTHAGAAPGDGRRDDRRADHPRLQRRRLDRRAGWRGWRRSRKTRWPATRT